MPSVPEQLVLEFERPVNCTGAHKDKSHIQFLLQFQNSYSEKNQTSTYLSVHSDIRFGTQLFSVQTHYGNLL